MFRYLICTCADADIYRKQCKAIENNIPFKRKEPELADVDGSLTQIYTSENGRIIVHNSTYYNEVFVESEFDLLPFFSK